MYVLPESLSLAAFRVVQEAVTNFLKHAGPTATATVDVSYAPRDVLIVVRDDGIGIAPEHLELAVADPDALLPRIRHAGAIFMGHYSSESLGDYCAGPNHVLPTSRTARFSSPLGVYDFQKRTSLIKVSKAGAQTLGRIASTLAQGEGLPAHAQSAEFRLGN